MRRHCGSIVFFVVISAALPAECGLTIVTTGDSNTVGFSPNLLDTLRVQQGLNIRPLSIASNGADAASYTGLTVDRNYQPAPAKHHQAVDAINGPVYAVAGSYGSKIEPNPEPDVIVVMLGTNDAVGTFRFGLQNWQTYKTQMSGVYDYLTTATTPGGKRPEIFVATPLPILADPSSAISVLAAQFVDTVMAPWIREQVAALAAAGRGIHLIDINQTIKQQPNWQSLYSDDGVTQGHYHLFGTGGYTWLATEVLHAILDQHGGDANLDGVTNGLDWTVLADRFMRPGNWSQGDFNHDGMVNGLDYNVWADNYENRVAAASVPTSFAVPEPAAWRCAAIGGALIAAFLKATKRWPMSKPSSRAGRQRSLALVRSASSGSAEYLPLKPTQAKQRVTAS